MVRRQREREYTLLSQSISFSVWHCTAKCFCSPMPVSHLSALAWVTAAVVGRPIQTSSSITEGRYNAPCLSHMLTNPIKCTQTLSELQIPINFLLTPWNYNSAGIVDNFIISWCISGKWRITGTLCDPAWLQMRCIPLAYIRIWRSIPW